MKMAPLLIIYIIGIPLSIVVLTILGEIGIRQMNSSFKIPIYRLEYFKVFLAAVLWPFVLVLILGLAIAKIFQGNGDT